MDAILALILLSLKLLYLFNIHLIIHDCADNTRLVLNSCDLSVKLIPTTN